MAVELPEPLQWVLLLLAGCRWPEADEDQLRDMADHCRKAAETLKDAGQGVDAAIKRAVEGQQGNAAEALTKYWATYTVGKGTDDDPGRLTATIKALDGMGDMLEQMANSAETAKIQIVAQLGILAFELATAEAEAPITAGASMVQVPGFIAAARAFVQTTLKTLLKDMVKMAAKQAAQMAAINLMAQGIELAEGHRKSIDWKEVGDNAKGGAIGGAAGHLIGAGLGGAAGKLGLGNLANSAGGKMAIGAATGVGADAATQYITTGKVDTSSLLGSGLSGGAGAGLSHMATRPGAHPPAPKPGDAPHIPGPVGPGEGGRQDGPPKFTKPDTSSGDSGSSYHGPSGESSSGSHSGGGTSRSDGFEPSSSNSGGGKSRSDGFEPSSSNSGGGKSRSDGFEPSSSHSGGGSSGSGESRVGGLSPFGSGRSGGDAPPSHSEGTGGGGRSHEQAPPAHEQSAGGGRTHEQPEATRPTREPVADQTPSRPAHEEPQPVRPSTHEPLSGQEPSRPVHEQPVRNEAEGQTVRPDSRGSGAPVREEPQAVRPSTHEPLSGQEPSRPVHEQPVRNEAEGQTARPDSRGSGAPVREEPQAVRPSTHEPLSSPEPSRPAHDNSPAGHESSAIDRDSVQPSGDDSSSRPAAAGPVPNLSGVLGGAAHLAGAASSGHGGGSGSSGGTHLDGARSATLPRPDGATVPGQGMPDGLGDTGPNSGAQSPNQTAVPPMGGAGFTPGPVGGGGSHIGGSGARPDAPSTAPRPATTGGTVGNHQQGGGGTLRPGGGRGTSPETHTGPERQHASNPKPTEHNGPTTPHERPVTEHEGEQRPRATDKRPIDKPGGLKEPTAHDRQRIEDAVPHDENGKPKTHPDPSEGDWVKQLNGDGHRAPGRNNNCADAALSFKDTYDGHPTPAAPRVENNGAGEKGGRDRIEQSLGGRFEHLGSGPDGHAKLQDTLLTSGPGSQALIISTDGEGRSHAWNVVNQDGKIVYVDPQMGRTSDKPLYAGEGGLFAVPLKSDGTALHPTDRPNSAANSGNHQGGPRTETAPKPDTAPKPETAPNTENRPKPEATPKPDTAPKPETAPKSETAPNAEARPKPEAAPKPETEHRPDSETDHESRPESEESPKPEDPRPDAEPSGWEDDTPSPYEGLENRRRIPGLEEIHQVADTLGIPRDELPVMVFVPDGATVSTKFSEFKEGWVGPPSKAGGDLTIGKIDGLKADDTTPAAVAISGKGGGAYVKGANGSPDVLVVNQRMNIKDGFPQDQVIQHELGHHKQALDQWSIDKSQNNPALIEYHNILTNEVVFHEDGKKPRLTYQKVDGQGGLSSGDAAKVKEHLGLDKDAHFPPSRYWAAVEGMPKNPNEQRLFDEIADAAGRKPYSDHPQVKQNFAKAYLVEHLKAQDRAAAAAAEAAAAAAASEAASPHVEQPAGPAPEVPPPFAQRPAGAAPEVPPPFARRPAGAAPEVPPPFAQRPAGGPPEVPPPFTQRPVGAPPEVPPTHRPVSEVSNPFGDQHAPSTGNSPTSEHSNPFGDEHAPSTGNSPTSEHSNPFGDEHAPSTGNSPASEHSNPFGDEHAGPSELRPSETPAGLGDSTQQPPHERSLTEHEGAGPRHPATDERPFDVEGGLKRPSEHDLKQLQDAVPHKEDGSPERHPDPLAGDWVKKLNGDGPGTPGRANNCADAALSLVDTYDGHPTPAAPRTEDNGHGEKGGRDRIEHALGGKFEHLGAGEEGHAKLQKTLLEGGHGAQAVIISTDAEGRSHAWNAMNHNGKIVYADPQLGRTSDKPLYGGEKSLFAVPLTPDRAPLHPTEHPDLHQGADDHPVETRQDPDNSDTSPNPEEHRPDDSPGATDDLPDLTEAHVPTPERMADYGRTLGIPEDRLPVMVFVPEGATVSTPLKDYASGVVGKDKLPSATLDLTLGHIDGGRTGDHSSATDFVRRMGEGAYIGPKDGRPGILVVNQSTAVGGFNQEHVIQHELGHHKQVLDGFGIDKSTTNPALIEYHNIFTNESKFVGEGGNLRKEYVPADGQGGLSSKAADVAKGALKEADPGFKKFRVPPEDYWKAAEQLSQHGTPNERELFGRIKEELDSGRYAGDNKARNNFAKAFLEAHAAKADATAGSEHVPPTGTPSPESSSSNSGAVPTSPPAPSTHGGPPPAPPTPPPAPSTHGGPPPAPPAPSHVASSHSVPPPAPPAPSHVASSHSVPPPAPPAPSHVASSHSVPPPAPPAPSHVASSHSVPPPAPPAPSHVPSQSNHGGPAHTETSSTHNPFETPFDTPPSSRPSTPSEDTAPRRPDSAPAGLRPDPEPAGLSGPNRSLLSDQGLTPEGRKLLHQSPEGPSLVYPPSNNKVEHAGKALANKFKSGLSPELKNVSNHLPVKDGNTHQTAGSTASGKPNAKIKDHTFKAYVDPATMTLVEPKVGENIREPLRNAIGPDALAYTGNKLLEEGAKLDYRSRETLAQQGERRQLLKDLAAQNQEKGTWIDGERVGRQLHDQGSAMEGVDRLLNGHGDDAGFPGMVIGEGHTNAATWPFLRDNMQQLKASGVDTVYLEALRDDAVQHDLDTYFDPRHDGPMPPTLKAAAAKYDQQYTAKLTEMLEAAKANNVKVRAVDGYPARTINEDGGTHERARLMNSYAHDAITSDAARNGKYLVVVGASHAHSTTGAGGTGRIPGTADLLELPAVHLTDGSGTPHNAPNRASGSTDPNNVRLSYLPTPSNHSPAGAPPQHTDATHQSAPANPGGLGPVHPDAQTPHGSSEHPEAQGPQHDQREGGTTDHRPGNEHDQREPGTTDHRPGNEHDDAGKPQNEGGPRHPASDGRPFEVEGGLKRPSEHEQQELHDAVPKNTDGTPQRHPDPRVGDWLKKLNGGEPHTANQKNNCLDAALAMVDTVNGHPTVAAPRLEGNGLGEKGGRDRAEQSLGAKFEHLGTGPDGHAKLAEMLRESGHGSQAVITSRDSDGRTHAWHAMNHEGQIVYSDPQLGRVSDKPLYAGEGGLFAIPLTPDRAPLHPSAAPKSDAPRADAEPGTTSTGPRIEPLTVAPRPDELAKLHQSPPGPALIFPPADSPAALAKYKSANRFNFKLESELKTATTGLPHNDLGRRHSGTVTEDGKPEIKVSPYSQSMKSHLDGPSLKAVNKPAAGAVEGKLGRMLFDRDPMNYGKYKGNEVLHEAGSFDFRTKPNYDAQLERVNVLERLAHQHSLQDWHPVDGEQVRHRLDQQPSAADGAGRLLRNDGDYVAPDGMVLGEGHTNSPSWKFLKDNMQGLKESGVDTLYLEALRDESFQRHLDAYLQPGGTMPHNLEKMVREYDKERKSPAGEGLYEMMLEAKANDMRVVAVDGFPARTPIDGAQNEQRARLMNSYAYDIIHNDQGRNGKFVAVVGGSHVLEHGTSVGHGTRIPGLADMLGVPPVRLTTPEGAAAEGSTGSADLRLGLMEPDAAFGHVVPGQHQEPAGVHPQFEDPAGSSFSRPEPEPLSPELAAKVSAFTGRTGVVDTQVAGDQLIALQTHTEQLYDRIRTNLGKLGLGEDGPTGRPGKPDTEVQYNLWSGGRNTAERYGGEELTGQAKAENSPGFMMSQTAEDPRARDELKLAYGDKWPPADAPYQQEFIKWMKGKEEAGGEGYRHDPNELQAEFTRLRDEARNRDGEVGADDGTVFVGEHGARFKNAWDRASDDVALHATLAMAGFRSYGLDEPLHNAPDRTAHPNPKETVQVRQEIPMAQRIAGQVTEDLHTNIEARREVAKLTSDEALKSKLNDLASRAEHGANEFKAGADQLTWTETTTADALKQLADHRKGSADRMLRGRDEFLSAVRDFDQALADHGVPAAHSDYVSAVRPPEDPAGLGDHQSHEPSAEEHQDGNVSHDGTEHDSNAHDNNAHDGVEDDGAEHPPVVPEPLPPVGTPEHGIMHDPRAFMGENLVSVDFAAGVRQRMPGLKPFEESNLLTAMRGRDQHWFELVPDPSAAATGKAGYHLVPAWEKYAEHYSDFPRPSSGLPPVKEDSHYVRGAYVPYESNKRADLNDLSTIGHTEVPLHPNPARPREGLVFTDAMNGCAFVATVEPGKDTFTAWHYQSYSASDALRTAAEFRASQTVTTWMGGGDYAAALPPGHTPAATNMLRHGPDGWEMVSQEVQKDARNPLVPPRVSRQSAVPFEVGTQTPEAVVKMTVDPYLIRAKEQLGHFDDEAYGLTKGLSLTNPHVRSLNQRMGQMRELLVEQKSLVEELQRPDATLEDIQSAAAALRAKNEEKRRFLTLHENHIQSLANQVLTDHQYRTTATLFSEFGKSDWIDVMADDANAQIQKRDAPAQQLAATELIGDPAGAPQERAFEPVPDDDPRALKLSGYVGGPGNVHPPMSNTLLGHVNPNQAPEQEGTGFRPGPELNASVENVEAYRDTHFGRPRVSGASVHGDAESATGSTPWTRPEAPAAFGKGDDAVKALMEKVQAGGKGTFATVLGVGEEGRAQAVALVHDRDGRLRWADLTERRVFEATGGMPRTFGLGWNLWASVSDPEENTISGPQDPYFTETFGAFTAPGREH
ncbi:toxin glutamine deamidase domain-containing protein [Kitasatospora griseola]|uniref:toxin glutamine deamidase domain-containing protein n=1 Tax=Kitasatospora griseola TaxID=2064 RepID=UPI0037FF1314